MNKKNLIGAIDIGTNTQRLLIWDIQKNKEYNRYLKTTRLGIDLIKSDFISDNVLKKNIVELKKILNICLADSIEQIYIFGTATLRKAKNANEFITEFYNETKYKIRILSGVEEAQFSFIGIINSIKIPEKINEISSIDIGGGSTEITVARRHSAGENVFEISNKKSIELGCLHLTKRFITAAPTDKTEYRNLNNYILNFVQKKLKYFNISQVLIGACGTVTALVTVKENMTEYNPEYIHNKLITLTEINAIESKLMKMNIAEREYYAGLKDQRGDVIIAGIAILKNIMKYFDISEITVSEYGILLGVIKSAADGKIKNW